MGVLENLRGGLLKAVTPIDQQGQQTTMVTTPEQMRSALLAYLGGGMVVPQDNALGYIQQGYNANLVVHTAVSYITRRAASLPVCIERTLSNGEVEKIYDSPALDLLKNPNPLMGYNEFAQQAIGFYLLTGNWYGYKISSTTRETGLPIQLYTLPSQYVEIKTKGNLNLADIDYYKLTNASQGQFEPEDVIHWRTPNYDYDNGQWLYGLSPLKAALQTLNVNNSNETAQAKMAQNLGAIGVMMHDHNNKGNPPTPDQLRQVQSSIGKKINGADNRGRVIATAMMYKWQQIGLSANDLKLIEQSNLSSRQLYALYGLSSSLFNDYEGATYNNMTEFKKAAYEDAILPANQGFLDKLSQSLLEPNERFVADTSKVEVLKKDQTELIRALSIAKYIPVSERQQMIGLTPDNVLDEYPEYSASAVAEMTPEELAERDKAMGLFKKFISEGN